MTKNIFFSLLTLLFFLSISGIAFAQNPFLKTKPKSENKQESKVINKQSSPGWLYQKIVGLQQKLRTSLSQHIQALKENPSSSTFFLILVVCFLYGVAHALGPGHGKAIIASWVVVSGAKFKKAAFTAAGAVFLHAFSAVILVFGAWLLLKQFVSPESEAFQVYLNIGAGLVLLALGIHYLIEYVHTIKKRDDNEKLKAFSKKHRPLFVILSIGLVPCPISILILTFSLGFGLIWHSFFFVLAFAFGMGVTLIGVAFLSWLFQDRLQKSKGKTMQFVFIHLIPLGSLSFFILSGLFFVFPHFYSLFS